MTIANPQSMLAEINVDEADIANVVLGQKAEIIAIAYGKEPLIGIVESIASSAKAAPGRQSLSFAVKLKLEQNQEGKHINLRPGMSCRAEVFTQGAQELLAVPVKAIQTKEDKDADLIENYVFVLEGEIAKRMVITTGTSDDSYQQILEGLKQGATIITGPNKILRHLKDGELVSLIKATTPKTGE